MVTSLLAQSVKNLPAVQETGIQFLGGEDPLEKEVATHPSILAWRIPWTEEPGRLHGVTKSRTRPSDEHIRTHDQSYSREMYYITVKVLLRHLNEKLIGNFFHSEFSGNKDLKDHGL